MVLSSLSMVFIWNHNIVVVLRFLNKKLAHLDEVQYVKKDDSTLPTPPPPRYRIWGIWNVSNIKFQHPTTLQWQSLRSTSNCVVMKVSLNLKQNNTSVPGLGVEYQKHF